MYIPGHRWVILVAAGARVRARALDDGASQSFFGYDGRGSPLQSALVRAQRFADPRRIVVVASSEDRWCWARELAGLPESNVLVQPVDRGTGPGVLLPLVRIVQRDPDAIVTIIPSDHRVEDEPLLASTLWDAVGSLGDRRRILLLGMTPSGPSADHAWIVPNPGSADGVRSVARLVDRPTSSVAEALFHRGALWNTSMLVARGVHLLDLFGMTQPQLRESLADRLGAIPTASAIADAYATLPPCDFTKDLLAHSAQRLHVVTAPPCGWVDLGARRGLAGRQGAMTNERWREALI